MLPAAKKDVLLANQRSRVIYEYLCYCDSRYVGRTTQRLQERIKQHAPKTVRQRTALTQKQRTHQSQPTRTQPNRKCKAKSKTQFKPEKDSQLKEHQSAIKQQKPENSALCEHVILFDHVIDWVNSRILKSESNFSKRLTAESWFILSRPKVIKSFRW